MIVALSSRPVFRVSLVGQCGTSTALTNICSPPASPPKKHTHTLNQDQPIIDSKEKISLNAYSCESHKSFSYDYLEYQ